MINFRFSKYASFVCEPLFLLGLLLRLLLICFAVPLTHSEWFVPFVEGSLFKVTSGWQFFLDPWANHLNQAGDSASFPYGPVMYLAYLPGVVLGILVREIFGISSMTLAPHLGFSAMTLIYDLALLFVLRGLLEFKAKDLLLYYWLSPLVIYICYWHGQVDILPVLLFVTALSFIKKLKPVETGILVGAAISAKLSMALAAPFIVIYLYRNRRLRSFFGPFVAALLVTVTLLQAPFLFSKAVRIMVFGTPEIQKVYNVALDLGNGVKIYLLPLIYALLLYATWRLERLSHDLLFAVLGIVFFLVLVFTPASSGWYLWVVPFLVSFQLSSGRIAVILGCSFSLLYTLTNLLFSSGARLRYYLLDYTDPLVSHDFFSFLSSNQSTHLHSLLVTGLCLLALVISIRMFLHGVKRNDYYRLSRSPLAIGIAGDSGSGKDTLARALAGLFGSEVVTSIHGDDYHKWDRRAPMWQAVTHLDPRANHLAQFSRDVSALLGGKSVACRHYDHESGKFKRIATVHHNHVLIVNGLHALYLPQVREKLDVRVFLDMDDDLRKYFKVRRDVHERGQELTQVLSSIERRKNDSDAFIQPQIQVSDIVFRLEPLNSVEADQASVIDRFKLCIALRKSVYYENLIRTLVGLCGLHVDYILNSTQGTIDLVVEGDVSSDDISLSARELIPEIDELLGIKPEWNEGMLGVMQLVTMCEAEESLRMRAN